MLERKDRWISDVMVVIMVNDEGSVVVFAVVLRGKRLGTSPPNMSSWLSHAHATRFCAQLNKALVGATHRPTSGTLFNDKEKGVTRRKLPQIPLLQSIRLSGCCQ